MWGYLRPRLCEVQSVISLSNLLVGHETWPSVLYSQELVASSGKPVRADTSFIRRPDKRASARRYDNTVTLGEPVDNMCSVLIVQDSSGGPKRQRDGFVEISSQLRKLTLLSLCISYVSWKRRQVKAVRADTSFIRWP